MVKRFGTWKFVVAMLFCLAVVVAGPLAFSEIPTTGDYNFSFNNSGQGAWMTVITSTYNKFTDCTVTWNGTRNGVAIGGNNGFVLPPYPGRGTAIVSRYQYLNVYNFNATCICKPRP